MGRGPRWTWWGWRTNQYFTLVISVFIVALADILDAFDLPENERKIEEARDSAGNDMLKMMQIVFPITTQIQMSVIGKYGFPEDGDGNCGVVLNYV